MKMAMTPLAIVRHVLRESFPRNGLWMTIAGVRTVPTVQGPMVRTDGIVAHVRPVGTNFAPYSIGTWARRRMIVLDVRRGVSRMKKVPRRVNVVR